MNRSEKSKGVKDTIINVSRDLFIEQGYKVTTIRQIIEKAGINTGSLYHFFRDKEDILLNIVVDAYNDFMQASKVFIGKINDTALQYAIIYALEMKVVEKYDRVAELYLESYNSWRITEYMVDMNVKRNRKFFHQYNENFNDTDYYIRTLSLRGMRLSIIAERVKKGNLSFEQKCPFLIESALSLFQVPCEIIEMAITNAMKMINEKSITIYGFTI